MTETAPLPLQKSDELTGEIAQLDSPYVNMEAHDVLSLRLKFLEQRNQEYLIEIQAMVDETITGKPEELSLLA